MPPPRSPFRQPQQSSLRQPSKIYINSTTHPTRSALPFVSLLRPEFQRIPLSSFLPRIKQQPFELMPLRLLSAIAKKSSGSYVLRLITPFGPIWTTVADGDDGTTRQSIHMNPYISSA